MTLSLRPFFQGLLCGSFGRVTLDLAYPRACEGCGGPVGAEGTYLCWDCLSELTLVREPFCSWCGDPVEGRVDAAFTCYACDNHPPGFDRARSAARFDRVMRTALHAFKYRQASWLAGDLVQVLKACVINQYDVARVDAICPVPLFAARYRQRGFNQAELLARGLSRQLHKPLLARCLIRVRDTRTQTNLTAPDRAANVRGAFASRWRAWLRGRRLLLVDDVMTTGATVSEGARALKQGGAAEVLVATVARG
jgi:ComF family protein